ncbi:unnamed protein product [Paramecium sonneborni]|uniref:Uncharacterized protein n=1 Tax=Paramecium sonneborni TaxID=65129 RepID=A0A8S1RSB5_9CILI|nr:unnamed protein product [Paramecium sonneborni]
MPCDIMVSGKMINSMVKVQNTGQIDRNIEVTVLKVKNMEKVSQILLIILDVGFLLKCLQGEGTYIWPENRVYKGQWKNNKIHGNGNGQMILQDSRQYIEDKKHGKGVFVWSDGKNLQKPGNKENYMKLESIIYKIKLQLVNGMKEQEISGLNKMKLINQLKNKKLKEKICFYKIDTSQIYLILNLIILCL